MRYYFVFTGGVEARCLVVSKIMPIFASVNEIGAGRFLSFYMLAMNRNEIINAVSAVVAERGCFLVDVALSVENDVTVVIEKSEGSVEMDDCVAVNNVVLDSFDRDVEDYSLTVTSAGLDQPFKVLGQYEKAVGRKVEAQFKGGRKLIGVLTAADETSVSISYVALEAVEGKKRKEKVEHLDTFQLSEVNSVRYVIEFSGK